MSPSSELSASALLERCRFPAAGTAVDCAVSGGPDSLALLVLACEAGLVVTAWHVDHGLRPGSAAEADVVASACSRFGAAFRSVTVQLENGPNVEARARRARYAALPAGVLTGHTADDQAETVLLNLLRGSGLDGLAGIRNDDGRRPILALRRWETAALCDSVGLVPVDDPSNRDPAFRRNRVRHELVPLLDDIAARDVVPLLARLAGLAAADVDLLDSLAASVDPQDGSAVAAAPGPIAARAVRRWLIEAGDGERHPPDLATVERVLAVARGEAVAAEVGGGRRVARTAGRLRIERPTRLPFVSFAEGSSADGPEVRDPHIGPVIVSADELSARVAELGKEITADYEGKAPLLVGVLKGAFVFMSDLSRQIALPVEFDFMAVSSYGNATTTSGVVRIVKDLDLDLSGRNVLIVEDIIDSGLTLSYLRRNLLARNPASLEICALLVKDGLQQDEPPLRYVGFRIPPEFVIGYGLDAAERYRNLPFICRYVE